MDGMFAGINHIASCFVQVEQQLPICGMSYQRTFRDHIANVLMEDLAMNHTELNPIEKYVMYDDLRLSFLSKSSSEKCTTIQHIDFK